MDFQMCLGNKILSALDICHVTNVLDLFMSMYTLHDFDNIIETKQRGKPRWYNNYNIIVYFEFYPIINSETGSYVDFYHKKTSFL